jgi:hypothetical protein
MENKQKAVILYQGSSHILPLLACEVHFEGDFSETQDRLKIIKTHEREWLEPLSIVGTDKNSNIVCCLAYGRYGPLYDRALLGVSNLFGLNLKIIDVDAILKKEASSHHWMMACLNRICWSTNYQRPSVIKETKNTIRKYITLEIGGIS